LQDNFPLANTGPTRISLRHPHSYVPSLLVHRRTFTFAGGPQRSSAETSPTYIQILRVAQTCTCSDATGNEMVST